MTSKRGLKNRLDDLDDGGDYPKVSLCEIIAADEIETVDQERGIVRIDGTLMKEIPGRKLNL